MQRGILVRPVVHGDTAQNVFGPAFRVLYFDVKIPALVEDARVYELVFQFVP